MPRIEKNGGTGSGTVVSVTGVLPITVDNTDPANPVVHFSGSTGSTPVRANKSMAASATSADGQLACATAIATTPAVSSAAGGGIGVRINGVSVLLGDGTKVAVDCYFSADGGATPRAEKTVLAGDLLYWNGSVALFELATSDLVDFVYNVDT